MNSFLDRLLSLYNLSLSSYEEMTKDVKDLELEDYHNFINIDIAEKRIKEAISKNEKIDVYVYEQLYYDNDSMNNYKRLLGSTIDVFLKNETKPFKEIMNELREKVSDVDWKSIITLTSLLTFGAATDFAIAAVVGSIAFLRKLNRELKEYREQLKKEKVFLEEKNGTETEDQESDMVL